MDEDQGPSQIVPQPRAAWSASRMAAGAKRLFFTREGLIGDYDYAFLFKPNLPFMKKSVHASPFFGLNDRMPLVLALLLGFQHALAMLAGLITPPIIMSGSGGVNLPQETQQYLVSASLIVSGILSIIQITRFNIYRTPYYIGTGLISVVGMSFTIIPVAGGVFEQMYNNGYCPVAEDGTRLACPDAYGALLGTAACCALLQILIAFVPPKILLRLVPPIVTGPTIMLIGVKLIQTGFKDWSGGSGCYQPTSDFFAVCPNVGAPNALPWGSAEYLGLGFSVFLTIILSERFGSPIMKSCSVVVGLLVGCIIAAATGYFDDSGITNAPVASFVWVHTFKLTVYGPLVLPMLSVYIICACEAIGDITASCDVSKVETEGPIYESRVQGGVLADGLNGVLAALMTITPMSCFAQNNGVIALTRCANRTAGYCACFFLIVMGIFAKFAASLVAIPKPVLGGMTTFLFTAVAVSGVSVIARGVPFTRRNRFILTAGFSVGYGATLVPTYFDHVFTYSGSNTALRGFMDAIQIVMESGFVVTAILCMILNLVLNEEIEDDDDVKTVQQIDATEGSIERQQSKEAEDTVRSKEAAAEEASDWQWLEEQLSPEALEWVNHENNLTVDTLDALPNTEALRDGLLELADSDVRNPDFWMAGPLFRLRKSATNQHGILERGERAPSGSVDQWRQVIDIEELGRAEDKEFDFYNYNFGSTVLGQEGSRLLVQLSNAGSDLIEIREVDGETGEVVADGFSTGPGHTTAAWLDQDHILIIHALTGGPTNAIGWPTTAYIWERGTPLEEATPVHSALTTDSLYTASNYGARDSHRGLIKRYVDYSTIIHYLVSLDGTVEEVPLPTAVTMTPPDVQTGRHLILALAQASVVNGTELPPGTVLAYDMEATDEPADSRTTIVHVPKENEFNPDIIVDGMRASHSRVYLTTTIEGRERRLVLEYDTPSWRLVRTTPTGDGLHAAVIASDRYTDDVVMSESGYLQPAKFWLENVDNESQHVLHEQTAVFNSDDFVATRGVAESKDGTLIDYLLLAPVESSHPAGELPVLVTGYGGFGITVTTGYLSFFVGGVAIVPWFEAGGALVVAYIRGGGERGDAWHQSAVRENRQRSYDDFIAIAEKLVADGLTVPEHMGVFGASHGGLLASVMGTQRPDLFGAVVADVPMTDMLRYHLMGSGAVWVDEYGHPDDPEMEPILRAYSPFHNVKEGTEYPPFLATISTTDDRVGPGHARKLIAKLKEVGSADAFLYEDRSGGHTVSDPFRNAALLARRMAFFIHYLM
ncbi:related to uric acid-xanthine permease [Cephalotrichum gorgonifer]|uniref:Related to uric acid-xanthine permease n=1 Tax=Cephalotrichum gorgonifer TaxID=2041049 RepID=A0AAE8N990_9PEZI|nr:related to uric acid-xanthine permease [Cephalotrichum gorgonifer]